MRLHGRRAVVTGAADGIGESIAVRFASEGAHVLAVDIQGDRLASLATAHRSIRLLNLDITADSAPELIAAAVLRELGGIDILVNNAGIAPASAFLETTDDLLRRVMAINFESMFRITRTLVPLLESSSYARIINLGSVLSAFGLPGQTPYVASKHAVAGLTRSLSAELGVRGITSNWIQPGFVVTRINEERMKDPEVTDYWLKKTALGRFGQPGDIAAAAAFLASDDASFISGQCITVDGGLTNWL